MYLPFTSHVPGFHLPIPSQAHGSYLPCTWLVSGFGHPCPVIPQSAIRNPHSPPCVLHKPFEYNSPPAPPLGWSGGTLDLPWTCPIPIEPLKPPFLISQAYSDHFPAAFLRRDDSGRRQTSGRRVHGASGSVLHCKNGSCSQAATNLQERDKPRNMPNTRKANREEVCFPHIPRIPRLVLPGFGCGFAALWTLQR